MESATDDHNNEPVSLGLRHHLGHDIHILAMARMVESVEDRYSVMEFTHITEPLEKETGKGEPGDVFYSSFMEDPAGKLIIDSRSGAVLEANKAAAEFLGKQGKPLKGCELHELTGLDKEQDAG